ncbi:MAG: tRNA (adenine(22)-N(1))-methyltransferase [Bacillota bacterium]
MNLSTRLLTVIDLISQPYSVADIGTDHAYLPIYLAQNFNCQRLIAGDSKLKPYQIAQQNIEEADLTNEIKLRLGNGLSVLTAGEVRSIVIAGLGANTICEIIANQQQIAMSAAELILQPMKGTAKLRKWLIEHGFQLTQEGLAQEGDRFYQVLVATVGSEEINDDFLLEIGPRLREEQPSSYREFLESKRNRWQQIVNQLPQNGRLATIKRSKELKRKIVKIEEVIRCL